ncbi:MAG: hypothetical protein RR928_16345 [Comamonas sp.]|uniref:hypothetical protein n=1 Tax=Comamonas sp. TaxID=34028 RepID=UPI002FC6251C
MTTEKPKRGALPGRVKAPEDKLCIGRPRKEPPPDAIEVIREAASKGATKKGAAFALQVSDDILSRWFNEHPELQEAFEKGRERERQTLHDVLYDAATKGSGKDSLIAAMFLLKSRHGYREGEQEAAQNRVQINFQLPGAKPLEAYVIENGAVSADTGAKRISGKPTRHS